MKIRITSRGQVTIPRSIREAAGLWPETEINLELDGDAVRIVKVDPGRPRGRGAIVVEHLRRSGGQLDMTTDEIMALTRGEH